MKKGFILIGVIVVAVIIAFFSFFWPMNDSSDLKGTIGGVEKAKKFRGEQMEAADLLLENEEFIAFTQSAEWQNAMKNEELVNFLKSDEFKSLIFMTGDMQKIILMNRYFDSVKLGLLKETDLNEATLKAVLKSNDSQDFGVLSPDSYKQFTFLISQEFQKAYANPANIESLDFTNLIRSLMNSNPTLKAVFSQDMQKLVNSQDFQKLVNSQDYQKMVNSQDFQNTILTSPSQDFQNMFISQDFQNVMVPLSQDFQKQFMSQEFQTLMQSDFFGIHIFFNNQDFQQLMFGAFQDYMGSLMN